MERNEPNKDKLADQSPDEAKNTVKDKVARGVATVAGALEGFAEQAKKDDLPNTTKEAVKKASETTRKTAETTREEGRKVMDSIQGSGSSGTGSQSSSTGSSSNQSSSSSTPSLGSMGSSNTPGTGGSGGGGGNAPGSSQPGLGRTAGRPDSPGVMRRSEGHGRSAAAELEQQDQEKLDNTQAGQLDKTRKTDKEADFERR